MEELLDISEVVRRTGLTSRALRFYEARGLLAPLRTNSGRRLYGAAALERINQIVALKRAGLSLAQIQRMTAGRPLDLRRLIAAQLEALDARQTEIAEARALLLSVQSRIDRGEPVDAATFCSLIRHGDTVMEQENWKKVADRYFTPEEQARWAEKMGEVPAGFDQQDYSRQWTELSARIEAALPLDPAGAEAQAFYDQWQALLAPFTAVATPEMMAGAANLYGKMDEWKDVQQPPFSMDVWRFIQEAGKARPC
jgi:DNA-binding transcriptional MerR regulator